MARVVSVAGVVVGISSLAYFIGIVEYMGWDRGFSTCWALLAVVCFVVSYVSHRIHKGEIILPSFVKKWGLGLLVIGMVVFIVIEGVIVYYANKKPQSGADYLVVLGAKENGTVVSQILGSRLDAAVGYAEDNRDTKIIVSGGKGLGEDVSEARAMYEYLMRKGVSQERIIMEEWSTNTKENIEFSKRLMEEDEDVAGLKVVVVSNGFHVYRATSIAKKSGLRNAEGLGARTNRILMVNYYVREAFAVVKDACMGNM